MTVSGSRTPSARILIVDDNPMGLAARRSVLEELGHKVHTCASAQEGLEQCQAQSFDLVITDYRMPKMNGAEFIQELKKQYPQIPIILISGFTDTLGLNESSTGADVVIQKSAQEVGRLIRAVARLTRKTAPKKKPAASTAAAADTTRKRA
jgi:CheY-like chemotaxis protein